MYVWMYGCTDVWMYGCMYVRTYMYQKWIILWRQKNTPGSFFVSPSLPPNLPNLPPKRVPKKVPKGPPCSSASVPTAFAGPTSRRETGYLVLPGRLARNLSLYLVFSSEIHLFISLIPFSHPKRPKRDKKPRQNTHQSPNQTKPDKTEIPTHTYPYTYPYLSIPVHTCLVYQPYPTLPYPTLSFPSHPIPSIHPSIHPSIYPSICVCLSVCLSVRPSIRLDT